MSATRFALARVYARRWHVACGLVMAGWVAAAMAAGNAGAAVVFGVIALACAIGWFRDRGPGWVGADPDWKDEYE
jgi:hypothetical protein